MARYARPRPMVMRALLYLWALPNTLLGLVLALLCVGSGGARWVDGVLEVHGPAIARLFTLLPSGRLAVRAMTLGHVVLGRDRRCLAETRAHERVHVAQYERWGPVFLPAYLLASLAAVSRGVDPYRGNRFERQATAVDCGDSGGVVA